MALTPLMPTVLLPFIQAILAAFWDDALHQLSEEERNLSVVYKWVWIMLVLLKSKHHSTKALPKTDQKGQWQRRILPVGRTLSSMFGCLLMFGVRDDQ